MFTIQKDDKVVTISVSEILDQMENGFPVGKKAASTQVASAQGGHGYSENVSPELEHKAKKVTDKFSESLHIIANEPSLAFFRIQEHVRKSMPQLLDKKHEVQDIQQQVQGACFDMEYAINAVRHMQRSRTHFQNIQDLMKNAMFMKQQIQYEQARKEQERLRPSMYRTMIRTHTVDIPMAQDLPSEMAAAAALPHDSPSRARSSSISESSPRTGRKFPDERK